MIMQIEKGWNQLFVSIISIETGETIAKSGKALVKNGECDWEDSMLSTIWISDYSLQDNQACLLKLLLAMVCFCTLVALLCFIKFHIFFCSFVSDNNVFYFHF